MSAPTLNLELTGTTVTASIDGEAGVSYELYMAAGSSEPWALAGSVLGPGEIEVADLDTAQVYLFIAIAKDGLNYSLPSTVETVTTGVDPASEGLFIAPMEALKNMLAGCPSFRQWCGATTGTSEENLQVALNKISEIHDKTLARPYAYMTFGDDYNAEVNAGGSRNYFAENGNVLLCFEADIAPAHINDDYASGKAFLGAGGIGTIITELMSLAGLGGYLNITGITQTDGPGRNPKGEVDKNKNPVHYWQVWFQISWS
ncbi:MAG: hypothetical protein JEZ07_06480 [Phycisphaerae bacterium]|nr:hypothetical protein [Phycisphaerae bacterium]